MEARVQLLDLDMRGFEGMALEDLAAFSEIADMLGVHKRTVQRYIARPDFPEPVGRLAGGRVWARADVEEWSRAHLPLPRPGRPRKRPA